MKLVQAATETPAWKETLTKMGWTPWFLAGDQFGSFLKEEDARVGKVLKDIGLVQLEQFFEQATELV